MLNKVVLIGRLVSEVQMRETQNGIPYTYFTLAVNRPRNNQQTDFVDCVAWRGTAEILDKYTSKGSLIAVEGRLEVYKTESNGNYETRVNVNAQSITLLDSRRNNEVNASKVQPTPSPVEAQREVEVKTETPATETSNNDSDDGGFDIDFDSLNF